MDLPQVVAVVVWRAHAHTGVRAHVRRRVTTWDWEGRPFRKEQVCDCAGVECGVS